MGSAVQPFSQNSYLQITTLLAIQTNKVIFHKGRGIHSSHEERGSAETRKEFVALRQFLLDTQGVTYSIHQLLRRHSSRMQFHFNSLVVFALQYLPYTMYFFLFFKRPESVQKQKCHSLSAMTVFTNPASPSQMMRIFVACCSRFRLIFPQNVKSICHAITHTSHQHPLAQIAQTSNLCLPHLSRTLHSIQKALMSNLIKDIIPTTSGSHVH